VKFTKIDSIRTDVDKDEPQRDVKLVGMELGEV
jgi:hypothetical protein